MTFGSGVDESGSDLSAYMSAVEDRALAGATSRTILASAPFEINRQLDPSDGVNYAGGSSYSDDMPLPESNLAGVMGAGGIGSEGQEARDALCSNMAGMSGLFETIGRTDTYLALMAGKPWPTPLDQGRVSAGYTFPTVSSRITDINVGWNAAAQPGDAPGTQYGYSDRTLGPSTWEEALNYAPSPLADKIGQLQGLGELSAVDPGLRKVLKAAGNPGTQNTGKVARELLAQSVKVAKLTAKRLKVMLEARKNYTKLVREVANIDSETQRLANNIFDPEGEPNDNVSVAQIRSFRKLRKKGFTLGREAIRYQKTNVIATALTKNGYSQAKMLQDMAMTMMTGRPKTTAVLAAQFELIGNVSKGLRAQRELQVANWSHKNAKDREAALEGLTDPRDAHIKSTLSADYWEQDLAGAEFFEMEYLGALEGFWGSVKKFAKKAVKKATKPIRKAAKAVKRTVKTAYKVTKAVSRGKFKKAGKLAYRHAKNETKRLIKKVKKTVKKSYRRTIKAARGVKRYAGKAYSSAKSVSKPVWRATKAAARVVIAPVKMTYNVGRNVARGDFKGAANSIARSVKETASGIATAYGEITFGIGCAIDRSPIGKAVAQGVGQAVGTFYGGAAGGAVGHEAGRKANEANRTICDGMDRIGLTRGRIRPNQIVPAFTKTAGRLAKQTFHPKELLKSGMNIGMNYIAGGAGGAGQAFTQVAQKGFTEAAKGYGKKFVRDQIEREIQNKINSSPELRALSRNTPAIRAAYAGIQAFRGGEVNMDSLKDTLIQQGKRYAPQAAGRLVGGRAGRAISTAGRLYNATPQQRANIARREALRQGAKYGSRAARAVGGRQAEQFVRSAGRVARMSPSERYRYAQQQAMRGGQRLATRAARSVGGPRSVGAMRRAQAIARMSPSQRMAYTRQQAVRSSRPVGRQAQRRYAALQRRAPNAHALARQRLGVPGALLRG